LAGKSFTSEPSGDKWLPDKTVGGYWLKVKVCMAGQVQIGKWQKAKLRLVLTGFFSLLTAKSVAIG
jgi:hypothetical protein